ncbi:MAG: tripartite tricarboxylate transporter substrate binding protein [Methylobacteriaceae bacterium]|nr:tripartite tricarboxylate transporter substrate binding protein [Methylobacteriaceae bacterium]
MPRPKLLLASGLALGLFAGLAAAGAVEIRLVAPSAPGTGWDELAQAARLALQRENDAPTITVVNVPGGSGTVGLAQFAEAAPEGSLLVTGLVMLEASIVNRSASQLETLTPIARMSEEHFGLAVPAKSPLASVADLAAALKGEPGKVAWAGGPARGIDHLAVVLFAQAAAIDPQRLNYVPFLTSQEAVGALAEERVGAALMPLSELDGEAKAGRVRILGVTAARRLPGQDAQALGEAGVPLVLANWRGIVAKPGLARADRDRLVELAGRVAASEPWQAALARRGWQPAFLAADEFQAFMSAEQARLKTGLKAAGLLKPATP